MKRHAVQILADINKAWQSAERWHKTPIVLKISASTKYINFVMRYATILIWTYMGQFLGAPIDYGQLEFTYLDTFIFHRIVVSVIIS